MDKQLLKVEDAAQAMSLGRSKTWELVAAGDLRVVRVGRAVRIPASEIDRYIAERLQPASAA